MATFLGVFVDCCLLTCCPSGCQGNTEQVVTQWQRPEAFGEALEMLHWVMQTALHPHNCMVIKMGRNRGAF
jgi:hypothetical protein